MPKLLNLLLVEQTWLESRELNINAFNPGIHDSTLIAIHLFDTTREEAQALLESLRLQVQDYELELLEYADGYYIFVTIPIIELVISLFISMIDKIYLVGAEIYEFYIHLTDKDLKTLQTTHQELLSHIQNINSDILIELVN